MSCWADCRNGAGRHSLLFFFFFQAEDGIRDLTVTGVQTCALPISFFLSPRHGPQSQPKKSAARDLIVKLRKQNHSVYEISQILKDRHSPLSPTGVREVLRAEGFAPLPRRLDEERSEEHTSELQSQP